MTKGEGFIFFFVAVVVLLLLFFLFYVARIARRNLISGSIGYVPLKFLRPTIRISLGGCTLYIHTHARAGRT